MSDVRSEAPQPATGPEDDFVQPFMIERSSLRGRLVRLGPVLDDILGRHAYPEPVAHLLAETIVMACLLSSGLKYDGVFTLQIAGDGPVSLVVVDVTSSGRIRGYARHSGALKADDTPLGLLGDGRMAFTVDQGPDTDRYQGIVALTGETLTDSFRHYFRQSEQLDVGVTVFVGRSSTRADQKQTGMWRAGALMIQRLPDQEKILPAADREELWSRAQIFMQSVKPDELLDPALTAHEILFRLFHEDGVRVFDPQAFHHGCRCSRQKILHTIASFPPEERETLKVDGKIAVVCEFCNTSYEVGERDLADLPADS